MGKRFGGNNEWGVRINALHANGDLAVDGTRDKKRDIAINIDHRAKRSKSNIFFSYDYDEQWGRNNTISLGKLDQIPAVPKIRLIWLPAGLMKSMKTIRLLQIMSSI